MTCHFRSCEFAYFSSLKRAQLQFVRSFIIQAIQSDWKNRLSFWNFNRFLAINQMTFFIYCITKKINELSRLKKMACSWLYINYIQAYSNLIFSFMKILIIYFLLLNTLANDFSLKSLKSKLKRNRPHQLAEADMQQCSRKEILKNNFFKLRLSFNPHAVEIYNFEWCKI